MDFFMLCEPSSKIAHIHITTLWSSTDASDKRHLVDICHMQFISWPTWP